MDASVLYEVARVLLDGCQVIARQLQGNCQMVARVFQVVARLGSARVFQVNSRQFPSNHLECPSNHPEHLSNQIFFRKYGNLVETFASCTNSSAYVSLFCRRVAFDNEGYCNGNRLTSNWTIQMTFTRATDLHDIKTATWTDINLQHSTIPAQIGMDNECRVMSVFDPGLVRQERMQIHWAEPAVWLLFSA